MKRQTLKKDKQTNEVRMTVQNLKICARNQEGYQTLYLNDSFHLHYCNFTKIQNLQQCISHETVTNNEQNSDQKHEVPEVRGVNTLFLNNNLIERIQNLHPLSKTLVTLNLAHNQINKFEGLKDLHNLAVLDLSHNKIRLIERQEISPLIKLKRLNLNANLFTTQESIQSIVQLKNNLETLQLSNNENFQPDVTILSEMFGQMNQLKVLMLKDTPFVRMTSAYRKQLILAVQSLTYLDQRPVAEDQRFLAKAWERGGLKEEQQARKLIRQKKEEKNQKIISEIQQRNKIIDTKVDKIFYIKAKDLVQQLQGLKTYTKSQDFELLSSSQESQINLKIQQLQTYIQLLRQQCKGMDLDQQLGTKKEELPKMLIEKRTPECIYVYNVKESLLQKIKQKYYPEETLPLKVVNYQKPKQIEWLSEYNQILDRLYRICKGNWDIILPSFNLQIYDFDLNAGRKLRRFSAKQLKTRFQQLSHLQNQEGQHNGTFINANQLRTPNELDCLD